MVADRTTTPKPRSTLFVGLTLLVLLVFVAWKLSTTLLLVFAGVLLSILFSRMANRVSKITRWSRTWSLMAVLAAIVAILVALAMWIGPQTVEQFAEMSVTLPQAVQTMLDALRQTQVGGYVMDRVAEIPKQTTTQALDLVRGGVTNTFGMLIDIFVVLSVSIFLALDPDLYRRGLLHLVPCPRRAHVGEVLDALSDGLWRWILATALSSLMVGIIAGVGLALLGVPLAAALGVIAGLTNIIPNFGPLIAGGIAAVIAFSVSPTIAIATIVLFVVINQVEGDVVLPLLLKRATNTPPAMTLLAVVIGGLLFGVLGMLLASPLLYVAMTLVMKLYVEDRLGDRASPVKATT